MEEGLLFFSAFHLELQLHVSYCFCCCEDFSISTVTVKLPMLKTRVSLTNLSVGMVRSSNGGHPSPQSFLI